MSASGHTPGAERAVLALDASTYAGSVAVLRGGRVLAERAAAMRGAEEERLMPAVAGVLEEAGVRAAALGAIVCGGGPGSFTSLRIAGAIAKGLATATSCELLAAPSLALAAATHAPERAAAVLVTLDAMRGERYAALVRLGAATGTVRPVIGYQYLGVHAADAAPALGARLGVDALLDAGERTPLARGVAAFALAVAGERWGAADALALAPVALEFWEPDYGRKAEAQVKWELAHGRALPADPAGALAPAGGGRA